jgi:cation-transporting ATPase E
MSPMINTAAAEATDPTPGLTTAEVAERTVDGRSNLAPAGPRRTVGEMIQANVLTPVNAIMLALFALILVAGHWRDGLFVGVVIANSVIGMAQELTARRELDRLEVLTAPRARARRNGVTGEIAVEDVVEDDVLMLEPGDQIVVDGEVLTANRLEVDEALLTGESDPVHKDPGDPLLSGSFVVAGTGDFLATAVGGASYAAGLAVEAKTQTPTRSELRSAINRILRWLMAIIPVASLLLLLSLLDVEPRWQEALQGTVAAAVAMVPDGLVLLTSLAFVSGVIALARRRALAKQLASVEILARVDVLCLDKTGTIPTGEISLVGVEPLAEADADGAWAALAALAAADEAPNATMVAIDRATGTAPAWEPVLVEPFSSERKWAATPFADHGSFYLGAPDVLVTRGADELMDRVADLGAEGRRVVLLATSDRAEIGDELPADLTPVAIVALEDAVRDDAPEIISYFVDQGVTLKVISGDAADTVGAVADRAGIPTAHATADARALPEDPDDLADALEASTVFGRVAPHQKRAMVEALQSRGHVVAMTGDGVNDVLALRSADLGIAMGSGSPASRSAADLVLTDSRFSTLPRVVTEGRRVINNVERVANLFVTKAGYAVVLTVLVGLASVPFPLLPRHLTLVGTFSIGLPGFILALAPQTDLVRPGFLRRVLWFSIPAGVLAGTATFAAYEAARRADAIDLVEARSLATVTLLSIGLIVLLVASRPFRPWKLALVAGMGLAYLTILVVNPLADYFELVELSNQSRLISTVAVLAAGIPIALLPRFVPALRDET